MLPSIPMYDMSITAVLSCNRSVGEQPGVVVMHACHGHVLSGGQTAALVARWSSLTVVACTYLELLMSPSEETAAGGP